MIPDFAELESRLKEIRTRIAGAASPGQRVEIIAVTKTFPPELTGLAIEAGLNNLGENYAQDLAAKAVHAEAQGLRPEWHFIGGLQRNKVKVLAGKIALWQTVDRLALVEEIAKRSPGDRILIQVNTTAEPQKSGCEPDQAQALVDRGRELGLVVEGLMTVGPTDQSDPRPHFEHLNRLAENCGVSHRSMGMSNDFERAIECGSTMIRVGSVLFGNRPV